MVGFTDFLFIHKSDRNEGIVKERERMNFLTNSHFHLLVYLTMMDNGTRPLDKTTSSPRPLPLAQNKFNRSLPCVTNGIRQRWMAAANALLSYQYYAIVLMTIGDVISVSLHLIWLNHRKCKNIVHHQHKFVEGDAMTGKKRLEWRSSLKSQT